MRSYEKSKTAFKEAQKLMPGGVNSPVRAFKSVDMGRFLWSAEKARKSLILTGMNILTTSCHGAFNFRAYK